MFIRQTNSTNDLLRSLITDYQQGKVVSDEVSTCLQQPLPVVHAGFQTAGRGQAGNTWESEEGKNLLFSVLLKQPKVPIQEGFRVAMWAALAIVKTLHDIPLTIKWPNDIYYEDKKLCGMLIENSITSAGWNYSIIGVGLNVNQTQWLSNAPNPVSIATITHQQKDLSSLLDNIIAQMVEDLSLLEDYENLKRQYFDFLYRKDGYHYYVEREVSVQPTDNQWDDLHGAFEAKIVDITPQGELILQLKDKQLRTYHFKQIRYVIKSKNEN